MHNPMLAVIIPVYGHFEYAYEAALSALLNSSCYSMIIWIDDCSPDYQSSQCRLALNAIKVIEPHRLVVRHHEENKGLTACWNHGLQVARDLNADWTVCGNSDLAFPFCWDVALRAALKNSAHLVGPVTNAPGTEAHQDVERHIFNYRLTDNREELNKVSQELIATHGSQFREASINGFCMMARTETWWQHTFDGEHVFRPRNDFSSRGAKNPTPLMTLNEYELQGRWKKAGLKIGFCPGSFVWHYRSVTRGNLYRSKGWYRM